MEGKGRFASIGEAISKEQAVRLRRARLLRPALPGPGHGLTYDPDCIAEVACTRRLGRHAGGEKK